ncbi:hypothetical protein OG596_37780 [Streptomyces sp. NBC_01102]|uniref:hypothetical protein n=1 Tax=unclassified Streptomyces TaxID=2593676 RepID=UPI00386F2DA4|nr:hypothetical protein OG596_00140 [Streptomyces sp. NBC_01102]WSU70708.1 hypothetical protein OG596_37780 [Streptomyces sp. NBC_01102]
MPQHEEAAAEQKDRAVQGCGAGHPEQVPVPESGERDPAAGSLPASSPEPRGEAAGTEVPAAGTGSTEEFGQPKKPGVGTVAAEGTAKAGEPVESGQSEGAGDAGGAGVAAGAASVGTSLVSKNVERPATAAVGAEGDGAEPGPTATAADTGAPAPREVGRPGKALLAAAAIAGVLLVSIPFLIAVGDDGDGGRPGASEAPGTVLGGGGTDAPGSFTAAPPDARQDGRPKAGGAGSGAEVSGSPAGGDTPEKEAKGGAGEPGTGTAPASTADKPAPAPKSGTSSQAPQAQAASTVVYTGVVGHGCPVPSGGGYKQVNYFSDGTAGWYTRTTGAWTGDGCNGSYAAVPMSGSTATDGKNRVMWWWRPGTGARTCQISVFIPHSNTTLYVGGHPSTYHVLVDANDRTTKYSSFTVNQAGLRGQWVSAGTFPVKGSTIGVKLLDRGDDWSSGWGKAHHAAAQMKATCRS